MQESSGLMDTSQIINDLVRDEGFVSHCYKDINGYWTIGFGRLVDERLGGGITESEAEVLLLNDTGRSLADLDRALPWWRGLSPAWQRGLVNMVFNLGLPRLLTFKRMLAALQFDDGDLAADEALDSVWAGQVGKRADRIAALYREK